MAKVESKSRSVFKRLLRATAPYWPLFVLGIIGTIALSLIDAGFAWLIKPIINKGFIARDSDFIHWLPIIVIVIFLMRSVAGFTSNYFVSRVSRFMVMDFRKKVFHRMLRLPARYYDKSSSGRLLSVLVYNVEQISQACSDALLILLRETSLAVGLMVVMFLVSWKLSLLLIVIMPVMMWVIKITSRRMRRLSGNVQDSVGTLSHLAEETINAFRVVRLFGGQTHEETKFNHAAEKSRQRELKVVVTNSIGTSIVQVVLSLPIAVILAVATLPSLHTSAGAFGALIASLLQFLRPVRRLTLVNNDIQKGLAGAESVFNLLDEPIESAAGVPFATRVQGEIRFDQVSFQYQAADSLALDNISLHIQSGETVALVGRSGAGKSTMAQLLPRFYECTEGVISIDGQDIASVGLDSLREQFALVEQECILFNDSIYANIAYGAFEQCSHEAVMRAVEAAHLMALLDDLPAGLETMVGENGAMLSGGQRQRLAIARALLKDAPILILDEATSALDSHAESHIQEALEALMKNRTTLVIAHRLSTIEKADRIIVMDKGRIVEQGSHQALLSKGGAYSALHDKQFKSES